jgi:hypothetical protein
LIDEAAEVDGCHAAHLLSAFRLSDSAPVGNGVIGGIAKLQEISAAVRGSMSIIFAWLCLKTRHGQQPCENSMENTALNLDFGASRCSLLQCGSESYRCPPWAFPP